MTACLLRRLASLLCGAILLAQAPPPQPAAPASLAPARALLSALAPERDDPDRIASDLLRAAFAAARSPVSSALVEAARQVGQLARDPRALLTQVEAAMQQVQHGLLQQECRAFAQDLRNRLLLPPDEGCFGEFADRALVVGPFGDAGSHFLDLPMPPDLGFPPLGASVPGRFGPVTCRLVERPRRRPELELGDPSRDSAGAHYVLWRVRTDAEAQAFVEVSYRGPFLLWLDGAPILRADPWTDWQPRTHRVLATLSAGEHEVVLKTGDDSSHPLRLRLCDAAGMPLPQTTTLDPTDPAAMRRPLLRPRLLPTQAPTTPRAHGFRDGLQALLEDIDEATAAERSELRVAAAQLALDTPDPRRLSRLLLQLDEEPPTEPSAQLALANLWLRAVDFPEEQRTAKARALEQAALAQLPPQHWKALAARVRRLEDQDQREEALRLLQPLLAGDGAGPATFALCLGALRNLRFASEIPPLLEAWASRCPQDPQPLLLLADRLVDLGDAAAAYDRVAAAGRLRPTDLGLLQRQVAMALDLGRIDEARALLAARGPALDSPERTARLRWLELAVAQASHDLDAQRQLLAAAESDPRADAKALRQTAERWVELGEDRRAAAAIEQSLLRDPDQPDLRRLLRRLGGEPFEGEDFAQFWHDGDAAIAAFVPGSEEQRASTTLVLDQRITEVFADGSQLVEVHELRAINDLQGVDAMKNAAAPAQADELLLLRTVGKDGRTYIPTKVEGGFSMPRLEPGAFVEWRYRMRVRAPRAEPWQCEPFLFQSEHEPLRLSEWVLIVPEGARGAVRARSIAETSAQQLPRDRVAHVFRRTMAPRLPQEAWPPPASERIPMAGYGEDASPLPQLRSQGRRLSWRTRPLPPIDDMAQQLVAGAATDRERLLRIVAFCHEEIADGDGSEPTAILLRRKGSRFTLALALLRSAGLAVDLCACESRRSDLGSDGPPLFLAADCAPMPCARVRLMDQEPVWLFPDLPRHSPIGLVPAQRQGALAFCCDQDAVSALRLPANGDASTAFVVTGQAKAESGRTRLSARIQVADVAGYGIADQLRRIPADRQQIAARQLSQQFLDGWRIQSAACVDLEPPGSPLALQATAQRPAAQAAGADRFLLACPLPPLSLRANFGDRDERVLALSLTADLSFSHTFRLEPGEGRRFAAPPEGLTAMFGPLDYQLTYRFDGDALILERRFRLRPGRIEPAVYAEWIALLARIDRAEEARIEMLAVQQGG